MTKTRLEYAPKAEARRPKLALVALTISSVAALLMAFAFLEGTTWSEDIGSLSLPLAFIGTTLTLIAAFQRSNRGALLLISIGISMTFWTVVAMMIIPKVMEDGF